MLSDKRTDDGLSSVTLLQTISTYRSETREQIVATIRKADPELVHRAGTIAGGVGDGSVFAAFAHIVDVEARWLHEHLLGEGNAGVSGPERYHDIEAVAAIWAQVSAGWDAYLASQTEASLAEDYQMRSGTRIASWLVPFHAFNHTTHHISEMWTALTSMGVQPPEIGVRKWAVERAERA
jgi:uncharacterized damage-inducible protein DinB